MKQFEFRLKSTMNWREQCLDREKSELTRLTGIKTQIVGSREALTSERDQLTSEASREGNTTAEDLHQMALFGRSIQNLERRLADEERKYTEQIESQRERTVQADRNHRLLVNLHDDRLRQWRSEMDRETEE